MRQNRHFIWIMVLLVFGLVLAFYSFASDASYHLISPAKKSMDTAQTNAIPANTAAAATNIVEIEPNNSPQQAQVLTGHDSWGPMAMAGGRLILRDLTRMVCLDVRG